MAPEGAIGLVVVKMIICCHLVTFLRVYTFKKSCTTEDLDMESQLEKIKKKKEDGNSASRGMLHDDIIVILSLFCIEQIIFTFFVLSSKVYGPCLK